MISTCRCLKKIKLMALSSPLRSSRRRTSLSVSRGTTSGVVTQFLVHPSGS